LLTMRGINIQGPGYLTGNASSHGILAHTRFVISHCQVENWGGDGLHVDNPTLPSGAHAVADFLQLHACWFQNIGQTAVYIHGPDTQIGMISRCGAINCGRVGGHAAALFWDDSFFGNLWLSCDANNILYSGGVPIAATLCPTTYRATNGNARATFLNC